MALSPETHARLRNRVGPNLYDEVLNTFTESEIEALLLDKGRNLDLTAAALLDGLADLSAGVTEVTIGPLKFKMSPDQYRSKAKELRNAWITSNAQSHVLKTVSVP